MGDSLHGETIQTVPDSSSFGDRTGIELTRTSTTRRFILWERVESELKITLVHQRKNSSGSWSTEPYEPLSKLKGGEAKRFILTFEETRGLFEELNNLYAIVDQSRLIAGVDDLVVAHTNEVIITDHNRAKVIRTLLTRGYSEDIWKALVQNDPDLATTLSYAQIHRERLAALGQFKQNLTAPCEEQWWQEFFEQNTWIFGYGLNYQFLRPLQSQPHYGGTSLSGKGAQKGDFLQTTQAEMKFTVLVEIKTPDGDLLGRKQYRNGAWELGDDLTGGVSQIQANCSKWEKEGSQTEDNREVLLQNKIFTVQPKGIFVIGHTKQLDKISKRNTFELFRRNLVNPEIITFDELYERARFIVQRTADQAGRI
jgi:hypothetical protein